MQSNSFFIIPLSAAYLSMCGLWFMLNKFGKSWNIQSIETSSKPWADFGISLVAAFAILGIGQAYTSGWLIPTGGNSIINQLIVWPLNNVLIFSPIIIALVLRKQSMKTIFISKEGLFLKLVFGLVASFTGILIFTGIRSEISRVPEILTSAVSIEALSNFPAIFFENIALAFLFVRLKWAIGIRWAIAIPSILFAFAHVPGSIAEGDPIGHILTFFFLTGGLTTFILYTAYRSRDIIWLGLVHYLMDVVIKAF